MTEPAAGGELPQVEKIGYPVQLSREVFQGAFERHSAGPLEELLFSIPRNPDPAYRRRVESVTTVQPTPEELASWEKTKAAWDVLQDSDHVTWCDGAMELDSRPAPYPKTVYSETWEEWQNRCRELDKNK